MLNTLDDLATKAKAIADRHNERVAQARSGPQPRNQAPPVTLDGTTAKIRLYQSIDDWGEWWGLSANELLTEVDALPSNIDTIELAINSPGGVVFESIAIMNALRRHRARIVAVVEGLAASAASFIAVSADETIMMPNSQMMIHAAWGVCAGDGADMREYADLLDELTLNICTVYEEKSGTPAAEWLDKMSGVDIWMTADEAVEAGLADRVGTEPAEPEAKISITDVVAKIGDDLPVVVEADWSIVDAELQLLAL